jgi:hypothetical protein
VRTIKLFAVIGLAVALVAVPALAADTKTYVVTNNTNRDQAGPLTASDLHITFQGTGGHVVVQGINSPQGCPTPRIKDSNNPPGTSTNTIEIDWGQPCVKPGDKVEVTVQTNQGPLAPAGGQWTGPGGPRPLVIDRDIQPKLPTLTEWGLIALAVLLAGGMGYMIYRRRPALRPAAP